MRCALKPKVFLAGIIQGSIPRDEIHDQNWREPIKQALARHVPQADVYCHYAHHPESITYDLPQIRTTLAEGDRRASECDLLVAYVPAASMGTAIEMYHAARSGAAVVTISPMAGNWVILAYSDRVFADVEQFEAFLARGELRKLLQEKGLPRR